MPTFRCTAHEGKAVIENLPYRDGTSFTITIDEQEATYRATAEEKAAVLRGLAQLDRGEYVSAKHVLAEISR